MASLASRRSPGISGPPAGSTRPADVSFTMVVVETGPDQALAASAVSGTVAA